MRTELRRLPLSPADILPVLVSTAVVVFTLAFGGKGLEIYRLQRHNAILEAEVGAQKQQQQDLQERLRVANTPAYVEKVAREQYRWVKAGETLVITIFQRRPVAQPTSISSPGSVRQTAAAQPNSHWQDWWNLLLGNRTNP